MRAIGPRAAGGFATTIGPHRNLAQQTIFLKLLWIEGGILGSMRHRMAANVVSAD